MSLTDLLSSLDLEIPQDATARLERLVDELLRWNQRRNLTAITDRDEVLEKHLVDSLTLLPCARKAKRLLDIGSGAGFPALPLKIACPELTVVSIDAVGKKVDFQRHAARVLGITGFMPVHGRIEALADSPEYYKGFDLVTARAVCSLEELIPLAEPFLKKEGCLVAMKGPDGKLEVADHKEALEKAGWIINTRALSLPLTAAERYLIELKKKQ